MLISALVTFIITLFILDTSDTPTSYDKHTIESKILNENREVIVKLPRGYEKENNKSYPVIYSFGGNSRTYNIAYDIDLLHRTGHLPEMIIVGVPNISQKTRQRDLTPPFLKQDLDDENSPLGQANKYLEFIEKELISLIENNYRTNLQRIAIGNSREGLMVTYSLTEKPELFSARLALSPALWRENNLMVSKLKEYLNQVDSINSFFFASMGTSEVEKMKNAYDETIELLKSVPINKKIRWNSYYMPDATHQNNALLTAPIGIVEYYKNE